MSNLCWVRMRISGRYEDISKIYDKLDGDRYFRLKTSNGKYTNKKFNFVSIFSITELEFWYKDIYYVEIEGEVKSSVKESLIVDNANNHLNLLEFTNMYNVCVEYYSEECEFEVQEHGYVQNGKLMTDELEPFYSIPNYFTDINFVSNSENKDRSKFECWVNYLNTVIGEGLIPRILTTCSLTLKDLENIYNKNSVESFIEIGGYDSWDFTLCEIK